jgi:regulator of protease activity HflC (stomatin/prohibitin superfamily)
MTDEALRRADGLLTELIETVETARALPMSSSCVLPREHLLDLLDELREVLPPEIDEARNVIATRERLLKESAERAADTRAQAAEAADATLAEAGRRAEQVVAEAEGRAGEIVQAGQAEHGRLVAATTVHQAAAAAAAALRQDAEAYQSQVTAQADARAEQLRVEADRYRDEARADADHYAQAARGEAERYATKLTADADTYAERTLDELAGVLQRAAATAEQGRSTLARRRADNWVDTGAAADAEDRVDESDDRQAPPISA